MKAKDFDKSFDNNENIVKHLNTGKARRIKQEQKRVNVDFPLWIINSLDKEARRLGVTRQSLIKVLVAGHFEQHNGAIN